MLKAFSTCHGLNRSLEPLLDLTRRLVSHLPEVRPKTRSLGLPFRLIRLGLARGPNLRASEGYFEGTSPWRSTNSEVHAIDLVNRFKE